MNEENKTDCLGDQETNASKAKVANCCLDRYNACENLNKELAILFTNAKGRLEISWELKTKLRDSGWEDVAVEWWQNNGWQIDDGDNS